MSRKQRFLRSAATRHWRYISMRPYISTSSRHRWSPAPTTEVSNIVLSRSERRVQPLFAPSPTQSKTFGAHLSLKTSLNRFFCRLCLPDRINLSSHPCKSRAEVSSYAWASDVESLLYPCASIKQVIFQRPTAESNSVCVLRTKHKTPNAGRISYFFF